MVQILEQTQEEKVKMYMKCTKKELISMLLQNQMLLEMATSNFRKLDASTTFETMHSWPDSSEVYKGSYTIF